VEEGGIGGGGGHRWRRGAQVEEGCIGGGGGHRWRRGA
jgi:hypothetical protein